MTGYETEQEISLRPFSSFSVAFKQASEIFYESEKRPELRQTTAIDVFKGLFRVKEVYMSKAKVVNTGVDTLVLNAFYTDDYGKLVKRELDPSLWRQLDEWKRAAQETHEECPTTLLFEDVVLHMCPNGAGQGQWPWMLKTKDITLYVSGGHWNGIASVRLALNICGPVRACLMRW
jgi:hypothetical protein